MRKRRILLIALAVLLLSACGKQSPAETEPVETIAAATEPTAPEVEYAMAEADGIPVVLAVLSRGDSVDVAGTFDEAHYVVKLETGYGLVEKNLLRLEGNTPFAPWTGYAYRDAKIYDNYRLAGEPVQTLKADTQVEVLEDLGWCYLVEYNGTAGYMKQETVAKNSSTSRKKEAPSSGGESGTVGEDGGEISLRFSGNATLLSTLAPQEGTVSGKAKVLADDTQAVLGYFDRGDKIPVLDQNEKEGYLTVYLDGLYAYVSGGYVQTAEEAAYTAWDGQTKNIVSLYGDFWMLGSPIHRLNANTAVKVLFELENSYLVEAEGVTGYMAKADVFPAEIETPEETAPAVTEPSKTVEPTPPKETTKGTEPTESAEPTEPKEPVEPSKPTESTIPTEAPEWTPPIL